MEFVNRIYPKDDDKLSLHNLTDASKKHINGLKQLTGEHEIDTVVGDSSPRDEQREKTSNGEEVKDVRKTQEIKWLKSLVVFCTDVSVVGLRYVVNTSASVFRRSVWILLILVGVAFTTYHIQNRIRYYFGYPVNVIIQEDHMEEMAFPTVTICNENRFSLSKMSSMGKCRSRLTISPR